MKGKNHLQALNHSREFKGVLCPAVGFGAGERTQDHFSVPWSLPGLEPQGVAKMDPRDGFLGNLGDLAQNCIQRANPRNFQAKLLFAGFFRVVRALSCLKLHFP